MRLLFTISYYSPYVSGLTLYVKRLAESLVKRNYRLTIITMRHKKELSGEEEINGVQIFRAKPLISVSKGFLSIDFAVKARRLVRENDAVIINLPQFEGIVPAFWGKILGKKIVSVYHCEVVLPGGLINLTAEFFLNLSNFLTLLLSDRVVTYTEDFMKHSKLLPFFQRKILTVYPPLNRPKVDNRVKKLIRKKIGIKQGFVIGVAARLSAEKGIEYLFEAIPLLIKKIQISKSKFQKKSKFQNLKTKDVTFKIVIAGSMEPVGEEGYRKKIMRLVVKHREYIVFLGELKESEMGAFYSLLDVLVLPSVNSTEAFGMVQVEAMLTGIPVVVSNLPGVRVAVEKTGMGEIVPAANSEKLAEGICAVLENREKYIKDKKNIGREFSMEKTIGFYEDLFKKFKKQIGA